MAKDRLVFDFGQQGDLFYIILEGKVDILIPTLEVGDDIPSHFLKLKPDGTFERLASRDE